MGVRQIKSPVEILFMSLETEKRVGNFEEIRFLSKSWFLVVDLKTAHRTVLLSSPHS